MKRFVSIAACLMLLTGCGKEDAVRHYRAPKSKPVAHPALPASDTGPRRTLAAIIERGPRTWFFKIMGSAEAVEGQKDAFEEFVRSIRFDAGGKDVTWTAPPTWTEVESSGMRYATLEIATPGAPLELTVVPLDGGAGGLLANVNRWREQIGLPSVDDAGLEALVRHEDAGGVPVLIVDLAEAAASVPPSESLAFEAPSGWTRAARPAQGRLLEFVIADGDRRALVTVSALGGSAGDLLSNVNRWRGQAGVDPIGEGDLGSVLRPINLLGRPGHLVDIVGPEQAITCAFVLGEPRSVFVKLSGPRDLVATHRTAFEAFARSLREPNE